ncbi:MAG: hypothetical protein KKB31_07215 [Nanoarchaeota archaeon]|nr:hypothetical protein [Nanoarchaeota archaeon]
MERNNQGYGYLRSFALGIIVAGAESRVDISQDDINRIDYLNAFIVTNNSDEVIDILLDGSSQKSIRVLSKNAVTMAGTKYRGMVIKNTSGTDTSAGEILVTIQKEFGRLEEFEQEKICVDGC